MENISKSKKYDAILVLGIDTNQKLFRYRVDKAISLYKRGIASKIIFSGRWWGGLKIRPENSEARLMAEYAKSQGIPAKDILLEEKSLTTLGNFYFTKTKILEPNRYRRIVIVTHRSHFPKARYLARKVLGRKYRIWLIEDDPKISSLVKEHNTVNDFLRLFPEIKDVKDGDAKAIRRILKKMSFYRRYKKI